MGELCSKHRNDNNFFYKVLDRKPEGIRPLGRQSCRWGSNIIINVKETGWENRKLVSTGSGWRPKISSCERGNQNSGSKKGGEFLDEMSSFSFSGLLIELSSIFLTGMYDTCYYCSVKKFSNESWVDAYCINKNSKPKLKYSYVGFEILTAVAMKSYIFWNITPCSPT
jgi:hypothetical protein